MAYFSRTVDTLRRMLSGEQPPVPSLDHEETTDDPADRAAQARRFQRPPFRPQLNAPLSPTDELAALALHSSSDTDDSDDQVLYATTPIPLSPPHALGPLVPTPRPDRRPSGPPQALQLPKFRPRRPPLPLQRAAPESSSEPKSARPPIVNPGELPAAARAHQRRFLRQCLHRAGVVDISIWEPVLLGLLAAFAAHVRTDVRAGDALDVRQYVKIKKIPGGWPADSRYVAGIVCTKHLAHRQMPTEIIRPRILLLTRALEYAPDRFLSLSVVLTEERDHLERLIDRVVAVAPTLVLVEHGVSNLAQEILWRRGVAFACHVKPHVLQQVARLTGARPVADLDTLATTAVPSPLGTCHSVVVEAYQHRDHPGIRKSYMYFNGCPNANGCSLVLRGADSIILARVKSVLSMLVFVTYSLRLETRLSRELFARSLPPPAIDVDVNGEPEATAVLEPGHRAAAALVPYTTTVLSTTPGVEFPPPYLLVRMRSVEGEYYRVRDEYHRFLLDRSRSTHLTIPSSLLTGNATGVSLTLQEEWANDLRLFHQYENILNDYALDLRAGESFIASHPAPAVDPLFHQNLYVGTTVLRPADRHVCHASEIHLVEYYQESDVSLGQYLEEMCLAPELRCPAPAPSGCGRPLEEHARSYVHGTGQITVTVGPEPPPLPGYADRLLVSSACTVCSRRTPPAAMSAATWQLSFGKFLEMLFYHTDLHCRADLCPHGLNHHHALAFSRGGHTARFRYTPVALAEVRIPALKLVIRSRTNAALKSADAERLRGLITRFWDSLTERLKGFDVWDLVAAERADYCRGDLSELLKIAAAERRYMLQFVDQVTENTHPADTLALNAVRTVVQEKVYDWDARFDQFARAYILPERDLRRNAGRKLRHLFLGQASQAATAGPAEPPTAASAEAPGSASAHTSPRLTARPLPDLGMPSTELRAPTDVMPHLPILGTSGDEEAGSDHAAEDLRWLPHPVNMDATVYRRLSRDWMAESATTSVAPRRETLSTPNTTTANTDDEPAPSDVPVPANLPWAGEDADGVLFPTASTLVPDTHGHLRTPAATALPRPFSMGLRLEGKQAKELANIPGECPAELNDDDDDDDNSSRRGDPLDLSSVPSSPVRTRPLVLPEGRPKPAGPLLTKNRPLVGVARRGNVDSRSQLPTPRPSSTVDPGLPPPLPASELPPRHASLRTPRPLASPSLLPQPSPSYFGASVRRPPLSSAHPAGAAAVRTGLATNARPKSGTGRQSPHPLDAKWRANVSRVAHRIQATLGRSTDPKQRLNRLFHTTNKLMRKTTGPARPRLELYSTVKDAVHRDQDEGDSVDTHPAGPSQARRPAGETSSVAGSERTTNAHSRPLRIRAPAVQRPSTTRNSTAGSSLVPRLTGRLGSSDPRLPRPASRTRASSSRNGPPSRHAESPASRRPISRPPVLPAPTRHDHSDGDDENESELAADSDDGSSSDSSNGGGGAGYLPSMGDGDEPDGEQMLAALLGADFFRLTDNPSETTVIEGGVSQPGDAPVVLSRRPSTYGRSHPHGVALPYLTPDLPLGDEPGTPPGSILDPTDDGTSLFGNSPTPATPHDPGTGATPAEQTSIIRAISNYLVPALTGLLLPLDYPFGPTVHILPDSAVVIYEDQPSSIIAYTLSSRDFRQQFTAVAHPSPSAPTTNDFSSTEPPPAPTGSAGGPSEDSPPTVLNLANPLSANPRDLEASLKSPQSNHARYEFSNGPAKFVCKIFFAEQFDALRRSCDCESVYVESLSRCSAWNASGGKSGSAFLKTLDNRFIIKQLSRAEMEAFLTFAPRYFAYLAEAIFHGLPTLLAKIYGLYSVSLKNPVTGAAVKLDVMIMENLFYERRLTKTFDLKGSLRNRLVEDTGRAEEVLLDENLVQHLRQAPLYIRDHAKELLRTSVWNDTLFLAKNDVVDYSLLVAIDEERHELVVGIVDFIRTFTWDKRLENWVKETGFLGGGGKQPTIVSPKQYKTRFREAMERYFTVVPDKYFNTSVVGSDTADHHAGPL